MSDPAVAGAPSPERSSGFAQAGAPRFWRTSLTVLLPFAGGYYLSYFYRSINAVIAPNLVADLALDAADLGLLSAAYFLAFAAFQIPLGLLLDRFGPRRVQAGLLLIAATGAMAFAAGDTLAGLIVARALIGLGVAGSLMASLKAIVLWFPRDLLPVFNSLVLFCGGLGALSATAPVELALGLVHWRAVFLALGLVTILVAGLIFVIVPEAAPDTAAAHGDLGEQWAGLGRVFRDRLFWRVAPVSAFCMGSGMAIQSLWAGPWLRDVAGLDREGVARHLLVLALALTLGFLATGVVADLLRRIGVQLMHVFSGGVGIYLLALAVISLQVGAADYWVWIVFGFVGNVTVVAYALLSQHFPAELAGRANTALNVLVFGCAFIAQYGIGAILDLWPVTASGGYAAMGYRLATVVAAVLVAAALAWQLWPRRGESN